METTYSAPPPPSTPHPPETHWPIGLVVRHARHQKRWGCIVGYDAQHADNVMVLWASPVRYRGLVLSTNPGNLAHIPEGFLYSDAERDQVAELSRQIWRCQQHLALLRQIEAPTQNVRYTMTRLANERDLAEVQRWLVLTWRGQ